MSTSNNNKNVGESISDWGLMIEPPLILDDPDTHEWTTQADMVVVGLGGAGVASALAGLEAGLSVVAVDRFDGGGSSAANGGVFYAGGGTSVQSEAGVEDDPQRMFDYLKQETGDIVSDETLRDFCESSAPTVDWLRDHGVPFQGSLYSKKASYPPLDKFLYHSDSSLSAPFRNLTPPAARGHRVYGRNGRKAWGLGGFLWEPLRDAALRLGLDFRRHAEAQQLALDRSGRVVGVRIARIADAQRSQSFSALIAKAGKWMAILPPSFPGARLTQAVGYRALLKARAVEAQARQTEWIRARHGVVLSGGGFILNSRMVRHFAPKYAAGLPNGTLGDNGSGIMLGVSAGGATSLMERVSAWRFLSPPRAWGQAMLVNGRGARFVNETWYGARIGDEMVEYNGGRSWIILDARLRRQALKDAFGRGVLSFQRDITLINTLFGAVRADDPAALARKLGFDEGTFLATLQDYNRAAAGACVDPFHKSADEMAVLDKGPWYAIDASVDSALFPLSCMTVGGLVVDETNGGVKRSDGTPIEGLYAAGRNAVGLCSHLYVSGLSYADCIWSGRRAARSIARESCRQQSLAASEKTGEEQLSF